MTLRGLPRRAPRVLLDPRTPASTQTAADFYRPSRLPGRVAKLALRGSGHSRLGTSLLQAVAGAPMVDPRVEIVAGWARDHLQDGVVLAAWLGSPGPHQKMTVAVGQGPHHPPAAFVKAAPTGAVAGDLLHEARSLVALAESPMVDHVPRLLGRWDDGGHTFVAVSALPGRPLRVGAQLDPPQLQLLQTLRRVDPRLVELDPVEGLVPSHGDFTPWNLRMTRSTASAFDWESFALRHPSWDLCHFLVQPAAVMSGLPVAVHVARLRSRLPAMVERHLGCTGREAREAVRAYCLESSADLEAEGAAGTDRRVVLRRTVAHSL